MTATPVGKIEIVQGLRAVAVLLVVWTHSIVAAAYESSPKQGSFFHLKSFGACGLDIFFVISGFIVSLVASRAVAQNQPSSRTFLSRRFTRIFPLYWILTGVIILEAQGGRYPILWHRVPWLPTLFLLPGWHYPVPPLILSLGWSLVFEIYFYLVLAAWMRLSPRHLIRNTMSVSGRHGRAGGYRRHPSTVAGDLVESGHAGVPVRVPDRPGGDEAWPQRLQIIALGLRWLPRGGHACLGPWLTAVAAIALATTIFTGYGNASEASSIMAGLDGWLRVGVWGVPSGLLVLGAVLWRPAMQSVPARGLVLLGDASYSIYLCTNPTRSMVEHFWRIFGHWGGDVGVVLCLLACVAAGLLCYLVVERPIMRFFHNWYKQLPFSAGRSEAA